jgi:hypothetical protein
MSKNGKIIYKDDAITVKEYKLTDNKSLIYMSDISGQRYFCIDKEQFEGIVNNFNLKKALEKYKE